MGILVLHGNTDFTNIVIVLNDIAKQRAQFTRMTEIEIATGVNNFKEGIECCRVIIINKLAEDNIVLRCTGRKECLRFTAQTLN